MKFIHTFWSKPMLNSKFGIRENHLKAILTDYSYSALCVHKWGEKIVLYTDEFGAKLLSFIPYDDVYILNTLDNEDIHFAAQIKFEALKRCDLGDVLIDGDLFLQKRESIDLIKEKLSRNDMIYSYFEPHDINCNGDMKEYYKFMLGKMNNVKYKHPFKLPSKWSDMNWMNTSLMAFTNKELLDSYIDQYFHHKSLFNNIDFGGTWPDIILEQYFLTIFVKDKYKSEPIIDDYYFDISSSHYSKYIGFAHLGCTKQLVNKDYEDILFKQNPRLYRAMLSQYDNYLKLLKTFII